MNAVHMHLLLNHFPVIGSLLGGSILLWGVFRNEMSVLKTGAFIVLIMALIAIPVYLTGEPAEEAVEHLPGVSEQLIEQHENAATLAMVVMELSGLVAGIALLMSWRKRGGAGLFWLAALLSVLSFGTMARTGYYGGKIRHTEIRTSAAATSNPEPGGKTTEKDDDD